jgi:hypothetical protein
MYKHGPRIGAGSTNCLAPAIFLHRYYRVMTLGKVLCDESGVSSDSDNHEGTYERQEMSVREHFTAIPDLANMCVAFVIV